MDIPASSPSGWSCTVVKMLVAEDILVVVIEEMVEELEVVVVAVVVVVVDGVGTVLKLAGRGMTSSKSLGFSQTDCFVTLL